MKLKNLVFESSFERLKTNSHQDTALKAVSFICLKNGETISMTNLNHTAQSLYLQHLLNSLALNLTLIFSISSFNVSSSSTNTQHLSKNLSLFSIFHIYKLHSVCYNITIEHHLYKKKEIK